MLILWMFFSQWILAQGVNTTAPEGVQFYRVKTLRCDEQKRKLVVLREFKQGGKSFRWAVDENTFKTEIIATEKLSHCRPLILAKSSPSYNDPTLASHYLLALQKYNAFDGHLQNQGLMGAKDHSNGTYLTIDLCPSTHEFNKDLFELVRQREWPVAIAVSGLWILKHGEDWRWLQQTLAHSPVTWVNHSRNHPVYPDEILKKKFSPTKYCSFKRESPPRFFSDSRAWSLMKPP
jgi:hypothetical protein